ncbi:hypothetical protein [[Phormidium] sp. ETS-05]|nr:hypothetical protein [[Phormidium] sp. ETS-05]
MARREATEDSDIDFWLTMIWEKSRLGFPEDY